MFKLLTRLVYSLDMQPQCTRNPDAKPARNAGKRAAASAANARKQAHAGQRPAHLDSLVADHFQ
eukprot:1891950-Alexandrium_andersonii.AAC.1